MNAPCRDCGVDTLPDDDDQVEWYMVHDHLWRQAGMAPHGGYLCVACLEQRLGRQLLPDDFTNAPVNHLPKRPGRYDWTSRAKRLRDRLVGQLSLFE